MNRSVISTKEAPAAIGPYSQGIGVSGMDKILFFSGQIAMDPTQDGPAVLQSASSVGDQTTQVMRNIEGLLNAAGAKFDNIAKTTIYLTEMKDFPVVNEIYGSYFSESPPARATVAVSQLPLNASVEIECIVVL